jgi:beta-glucosidase
MRSTNPDFQVTFDLTNSGSVAGAEVAQVYLGLPAGWRKVFLQPAEVRHVIIEIDENDTAHLLSWWDIGSNAWSTAPGDYTVYVGNSSAGAGLNRAGLLHVTL